MPWRRAKNQKGQTFLNYMPSKFETCKFRSDKPKEYFVQRCCGRSEIKEGYVCELLKINGLEEFNCENCDKYQAK